MALAALLWHIGLHTDSAYLDQAETVVHAVKEISPDDPAVWALLSLVYASMAPRRVSEHRNAASEMRRLAKLRNSRKLAGNPYLQVFLCHVSAFCSLCSCTACIRDLLNTVRMVKVKQLLSLTSTELCLVVLAKNKCWLSARAAGLKAYS